jgi:hypothetical protein
VAGILRVKKWDEFQHYKERNPPWIKLHKGYLDNYEFQRLPVDSRALAPMIWLLASESKDGFIDYDLEKIGFRIRMSSLELEAALVPLISGGFLELDGVAIRPLAPRRQDLLPETEAETQEEAEERQNPGQQVAPVLEQKTDSISRETIDDVADDLPVYLERSDVGEAIRAWNAMARTNELSSVNKVTSTRRAATKRRIADIGGLPNFLEAVAKVATIPGLLGRANGNRHDGWKMTYDDFISEKKFTKFMEGGYDHWGKPSSNNLGVTDIARDLIASLPHESTV